MTWPFGELKPAAYDVVVIDPAWTFRLWSNKGIRKAPQAQYRCQTLEEIMALPVRDLLRPRGAVVMWSTWPLVARGDHAAVMRCWGLHPLTGGAWAKRTRSGKLRWGPGFVVRSVCEPFFFAALDGDHHRLRGRGIANLVESLEGAVVDGRAREHSRKPAEFYEMVRRLTPGARRADVFSRQRIPGFDGFGDELDKFEAGVDCGPPVRDRSPTRGRRAA